MCHRNITPHARNYVLPSNISTLVHSESEIMILQIFPRRKKEKIPTYAYKINHIQGRSAEGRQCNDKMIVGM